MEITKEQKAIIKQALKEARGRAFATDNQLTIGQGTGQQEGIQWMIKILNINMGDEK